MNERIKQLADEAIEDMPGAWNIPDEFCEKFAELIVREYSYDVMNLTAARGTQLAMAARHWGVEL